MVKFYNDWEEWKYFLSKAMHAGEVVGISDDKIGWMAYQFGKLIHMVDPRNKGQAALAEMWSVGDEEDRRVLAKLMTKIVDNYDKIQKH
ncbi:MAG: hypothetical protein APF76_10030 [Desulfitibacter sp. BRH_c19]|nr:MAG: hypothetical protein APF76_10030 [Desulfitibacter sp. BRH_c19]